ncbi:mt-a70 family [Diplodia corticola]|uniref:Mt-a70 family n=1 Tax=Diplodia corticola TaxID=236234 RepID=A0A1J9REV0_9PEZI|nr:mt-a70 family [Diplodia corticola]OJD38610.1 mt-a70 family [Diplodia corticola]
MYGIIWNNKDLTVFLVDIPGSIAAAQVLKLQRNTSHPLSGQPVLQPYDNIPKGRSEKKRMAMEENVPPMMKLVYEEIRPYVSDALDQIKAALKTKLWCEDRYYVAKPFRDQVLEQENEDPNGDKGHTVRDSALGSDTGTTDDRVGALKIPAKLMHFLVQGYPHIRKAESQGPNDEPPSFPQDLHRFLHNPHDTTLKLSYVPDNETAEDMKRRGETKAYGEQTPAYGKPQRFRIPPAATVILGDCKNGRDLHRAVEYMHNEHDHPKKFDLIIMDPPWSNASAKATGFYDTFGSVTGMDTMFDRMDLDSRIARGGFIGVWVTNSEQKRSYVLGPQGLFARWGVALVEEWVWVKTTVDGTPVIDLDSTWRKPWECLLLGQAPDKPGVRWPPVGNWPVKRRVIAAVPDLHSVKPCLKPVIEKVWRKAEGQYTALEIFGRVSVAGWWTWGNEAIKFNWDRYWLADGEKREGVEKWDGEEYLSQRDLVAAGEDRSEEKPAALEKVGEKRKASSLE